jgi:hypothetical protein
MIDHRNPGIRPPHEAFYLEALLFCTTAGLSAAERVRIALNQGAPCSPASPEWQASAHEILDAVQTIALQAAALSRYFWPARKEKLHLDRAARLRAGLRVRDSSSLRDRELRNLLEHFDERLDTFCQTLATGVILPTYVGPLDDGPQLPVHLFRAYYTDTGVFEALGQRFEMLPILREIEDLHGVLVGCAEIGGRIPPPPLAEQLSQS